MNILGPGKDAHRALSLGRQGADRVTFFHVRSDPVRDEDRFFYEEKETPRGAQCDSGYSQIGRLSSRERDAAKTRLREYGQKDHNIPRISSGTNCHNFATGAVGVLEDSGYARPGSYAFWEGQHHRRQSAVAADLEREGRHFEHTARAPCTSSPEYTFGRDIEERRPPGRLNMAAFEHLESGRPVSQSGG